MTYNALLNTLYGVLVPTKNAVLERLPMRVPMF